MNRIYIITMLAGMSLLSLLMESCTLENRGNASNETPSNLMAISGMDKINDSTYLTVYDLKSHEEGNRIGVIEVSPEGGINVFPVAVSDWLHDDGKGSDLESVCSLPNRDNEFLIAESGKWDGKFGRMFHLKLIGDSKSYEAQIVGVFDLPEFDAKGPGDGAGDEIEGLACQSKNTGKVWVYFGERGGSEAYQNGVIRWAEADLNDHTLTWTETGQVGIQVNAPGPWVDISSNRDISGLHIDENNTLWATASEELGENGPFNSIVYKVGKVQSNFEDPIRMSDQMDVRYTLNGYKAEAISGGTGLIQGSVFTVGTEDELLGGSWRVLN